ncbi:MAG: cell division protein ZapA [Pseudomonadota bacterium]
MGKVSLDINGRAYGMGCEDGEEERLERLGRKLDARVQQMAQQFGQIGDVRLLVMAGITLLDEMEDPQGSSDAQVAQAEARLDAAETARQASDAQAAQSLMDAARRIERLTERLTEAGKDAD